MDESKYVNSLIRHATRNLIISDYILLIQTDQNFQKIFEKLKSQLVIAYWIIGKWFSRSMLAHANQTSILQTSFIKDPPLGA